MKRKGKLSFHIIKKPEPAPRPKKRTVSPKKPKHKKAGQKRNQPPAAKLPKKRGHKPAPINKKQRAKEANAGEKREYVRTGIEGLDKLFERGVPKGISVLLAGGAGSGKTIMGLQMLANACRRGEKCLYMSFEESEERLKQHMEDFGWNAEEFEKKGLLRIKRFSLFDVARSIDALLEKAKGELLIDLNPIILPQGFRPSWVIVDSVTAIASAFAKKGDTYRSYIEQLFRFFEGIKANAFFISETKEMPTVYSPTGVEEFLADGVIILYNIRMGNIRQNAIEVLKMRGAKHQKRIVAMQITDGTGVEVYPEQEVFTSSQKS